MAALQGEVLVGRWSAVRGGVGVRLGVSATVAEPAGVRVEVGVRKGPRCDWVGREVVEPVNWKRCSSAAPRFRVKEPSKRESSAS